MGSLYPRSRGPTEGYVRSLPNNAIDLCLPGFAILRNHCQLIADAHMGSQDPDAPLARFKESGGCLMVSHQFCTRKFRIFVAICFADKHIYLKSNILLTELHFSNPIYDSRIIKQ
jgi:hypothetical protein